MHSHPAYIHFSLPCLSFDAMAVHSVKLLCHMTLWATVLFGGLNQAIAATSPCTSPLTTYEVPSSSTYVSKRTNSTEVILGSYTTAFSIEGCLLSTSNNEAVARVATYVNSMRFNKTSYTFNASTGQAVMEYNYPCITCSSQVKENLKIRVTRDLIVFDKSGRVCSALPLDDQLNNSGPFVDSGTSSSAQSISTACNKITVRVKVDLVQTGAALLSAQAISFDATIDLPRTVVEVYGSKAIQQASIYQTTFYSSNKTVLIAPTPTCTFSSPVQTIALNSLPIQAITPSDTTSLLQPKKFQLTLTGCSTADQPRSVNLMWNFSKTNASKNRLLNTAASDSSKGVDLLIQAEVGQKMQLLDGSPFADLTIASDETYRVLDHAANNTLNFTTAYVANGEAPAAGQFTSTATVTLSYE